MKKIFILPLFLFTLINGLIAQTTPPAVSNVRTRISEEQDKVTVTYDLARRTGVSGYNIAIKITLDGEIIDARAISGDVGPNVVPGFGKRIEWDVLKDLSELSGELKIEVIAGGGSSSGQPCVPIKTVPVYAGLGGAGAAGVTLILSGLKLESDSKTFYDVYKNNLDPNSSVYTEMSREEHYKEANSKHKQGAWLTAGGAAVIAAGGGILITRLIQIKRYNKKCASGQSMGALNWNIEPIFTADAQTGSSGVGIKIKF